MESDIQAAKAWNRTKGVLHAKNAEESNECYTKWVDSYEVDMLAILGCGHVKDAIVRKTLAHIPNKETSLTLDLAAGTGIVGEKFRMSGYKGVIDAIEWNTAMLEKARAKGVYRKCISFKITPEDALPVGEDLYDAVTVVGAFAPNHLEPGCLKQIHQCLKPGGVLSFYTSKSRKWIEYLTEFEEVIKNLKEVGKLALIEANEIQHYDSDAAAGVTAVIQIFKKLK